MKRIPKKYIFLKSIGALILILLSTLCCLTATSQNKKGQVNTDKRKIEKTITNFLKWNRTEQNKGSISQTDTSKKVHSITKGGYPDTTTKTRIDMEEVGDYLNTLRNTGYFSETYLNYLMSYYKGIDDNLEKGPITKTLVKINGLDIDVFLQTYDTDDILNHIKEGKLDRVYIIYNKAIARFTISKAVKMLFTLTKINNKWLIDYIGYDNTSKFSLGRE